MSDSPPDDEKANDIVLPKKTLLEQMAAEGVDEFYVTFDLSADLGPNEFKIAFISSKAEK